MTPQSIKDASFIYTRNLIKSTVIEEGFSSERVFNAYIAGATAENERAQGLVDALEGLLQWHNTALGYGLGRKIEAAIDALAKWKGEAEQKKDHQLICHLSIDEKKKLLAEKIETRMKEVKLNRQEFADLMNTQPSTITRWLSGNHNFQIETLFEIERKLNFNLFIYE